MRVVMVLGTSTGGIGHHVRSLAQSFVAADDDVLVAAPKSTQQAFGFERVGARVATVDVGSTPRPRHDIISARALRTLLEGPDRPDVVHAHGLRAGFLAVLALRGAAPRPPLVVTWHNAVLGGGARRQVLVALERVVARGADVTLGASADLVERARTLGASDARPGPVAAPAHRSPGRSRADVRAQLLGEAGLLGGDDRPLILAVGRLAEQKDYPTLLAAVGEHWPAGQPKPLLAVAGDGPLREGLQRAITSRSLPALLLGQRSDVPDLLAAADVYALSSRWEARALVVQEAARAGVPVVATAVGGVPELVAGAAVLVPPGDPAALGAALARVVGDPVEREHLAAAALERSTTWPDEQATAREVRDVYLGLLGRPDC